MDKNEYNAKLAEIDQLVDQGNYTKAAELADQIDWRRVRNVRTLCMISEIYEAVDRFEDSKTLLLRAYRKSSVGRTILYRLVEVTIQLKQFDEAIEFYSEYVQAAPNDINRYILKYKIYRARGSSVEEQIEIMKELLDHEYSEKYAYKLAELYLEADRIQECLATCDDLVLWFHSGKYVIKALELKRKYAPLTPKQQEIYDHRFDASEEELPEIGQEKQIVDTSDATLAEAIMEDMEKSIADEVAEAAKEVSETQIFDTEAIRQAREQVQPQEDLSATRAIELPEEVKKDLMEITSDEAEEEKENSMPAETSAEKAEEPTAVIEEQKAEEPAAEPEEQKAEEPAAEPEEQKTEEPAAEIEEQKAEEPAAKYDTQELQTEMIRSMREIVAGVGLRDLIDEDEEAKNQLIEESKQDQEAALEAQEIRMNRKLTVPELQKRRAAGQLSIDDVLTSMGDKGAAVRSAVKETKPVLPQPEGVLSAVDEALLNMGVKPVKVMEPEKEEPKAVEPEMTEAIAKENEIEKVIAAEAVEEEVEEELAAEKEMLTEEGIAEEAVEEEIAEEQAVIAEKAKAATQDLSEVGRALAEAFEETAPEETERAMEEMVGVSSEREDARQNLRMDEVITAKTRRIPTEEIAERQAQFEEQSRNENRDGASENSDPAMQYAPEPREMWLKPQLRGLFDGYLNIGDLEKQIANAIEEAMQKGADRTSRSGNILLFGGHGCGKTTVATALAKAIATEKGSQSVKMAKIYATDLNRKDIAATLAKIAGGVLIVEEAGDLDDSVADQLSTAMEFRTDGLIIILEDEQRYMHDLLMRHPRLTMKFTSQIYIPAFTTRELAGFGALYADDLDYQISEAGMEAMVRKLDSLQQAGEMLTIGNALEMVDKAIARANKFGRKLFAGKKRYDAEGRVILLEKDFR